MGNDWLSTKQESEPWPGMEDPTLSLWGGESFTYLHFYCALTYPTPQQCSKEEH